MTNFLLFLNFAAMTSGVVFYWIESRRRRNAEAAIFDEISRSLNHEKDDLDNQKKQHDAMVFLLKRSKFLRQLIDGLSTRLDVQETCFAEFGSFISLLTTELVPDRLNAKARLQKMFNALEQAKKDFDNITPVQNDEI